MPTASPVLAPTSQTHRVPTELETDSNPKKKFCVLFWDTSPPLGGSSFKLLKYIALFNIKTEHKAITLNYSLWLAMNFVVTHAAITMCDTTHRLRQTTHPKRIREAIKHRYEWLTTGFPAPLSR
jgi:hypothetical protein